METTILSRMTIEFKGGYGMKIIALVFCLSLYGCCSLCEWQMVIKELNQSGRCIACHENTKEAM